MEITLTTNLKPNKPQEEEFKIQKIMGNSGPVILYNKNRDLYAELPMSPELAMLLDKQYKVYVKAYIDEDGILKIIEKLSWRPW